MQVLYCMTLLFLGKNHPKRHVSGLVSTHPRVIRSKPFGGIRSFYSLSALGLPTPIVKESLNKARLTALHAICVQIFRHIAQKSLAIRQYACGISVQSAEKSDYASYAQALFSVSLSIFA